MGGGRWPMKLIQSDQTNWAGWLPKVDSQTLYIGLILSAGGVDLHCDAGIKCTTGVALSHFELFQARLHCRGIAQHSKSQTPLRGEGKYSTYLVVIVSSFCRPTSCRIFHDFP